jgi:hypothetical protein
MSEPLRDKPLVIRGRCVAAGTEIVELSRYGRCYVDIYQ